MLQWAGSDLDKSQAHAVVGAWDEVVQYLAPPGVVWKWGDTGFTHATLYRLQSEGLIRPVRGGWETTSAMWRFVLSHVGADETVGADAEGQETLTSTESPGRSRTASDGGRSRQARTEQAALNTTTGDDTSNIGNAAAEKYRENRSHGIDSDDDDGTGLDNGQRCLHEFDEFDEPDADHDVRPQPVVN